MTEILYRIEGSAAVITLNRPERLNAWTTSMTTRFRDAVRRAETDPEVRGIVLTGAGRAFCAGADVELLGETGTAGGNTEGMESLRHTAKEDSASDFSGEYTWLLDIPKPVIAAINGPVAGMAVPIALCCDVRFMAADAEMLMAFSRWGLTAEWGVAWLLPRLVGTGRAIDILLSSRPVSGREAETMGLVSRSLPADEVLPHSIAYVTFLAENCSPYSMATIKHQMYAALNESLGLSERKALRIMLESFAGSDFSESLLAKVEKRRPNFSALLPTSDA